MADRYCVACNLIRKARTLRKSTRLSDDAHCFKKDGGSGDSKGLQPDYSTSVFIVKKFSFPAGTGKGKMRHRTIRFVALCRCRTGTVLLRSQQPATTVRREGKRCNRKTFTGCSEPVTCGPHRSRTSPRRRRQSSRLLPSQRLLFPRGSRARRSRPCRGHRSRRCP